jgi:hypothetical protein
MIPYPQRSSIQEATDYVIRILGTGATTPTKQEGEGVTVSYVATGKYKITWAENPFQFVGVTCGLLATTMADLKGYTVVFEDYNSTAFTMQFTVYNSSFAAADLAATQRLCINVKFARTGY